MNIYQRKYRWKLLLIIAATIIVGISIWYTNDLGREIAQQERKKVELWANATKYFISAEGNTDLSFISEVLRSNTTVPVILTDNYGNIIAHRNLDSAKALDTIYLNKQLANMKEANEPIVANITDEYKNFIYYDDSFLLTQLKYYPFWQLAIIGVFLIVAYLAFSSSRKAEQDQVWVGMAKETAHQLGTPVSSLVAWIEYLKTQVQESSKLHQTIDEMHHDVQRLELITDRFSKVGSQPMLEKNDIIQSLEDTVGYIKNRTSKKVAFSVKNNHHENLFVAINPPLFNWVIENLLKNALDAMSGEGSIDISVDKINRKISIDIRDSGKGIPKSQFKTVFNPGFSTKKRGWGLGLSLCKRIVEQYHHGKIFVKESVVGEYTVFRIILPIA